MTTISTRPGFRSGMVFLAMVLLLAPCAWPQATTGAVSGTVRDQSGAVIPNAPVVLTNTATNISENTRTNEAGFYIYPVVMPGPYRVSIESPGMQKYEGAVTVRVAERIVIDPVLQAGQVSTSVQVTDVTPLVTTDNPTVNSVLENERIQQLPINGRDIRNLINTIPSLESWRVFGSSADGTEWILNGAVVTDRRWCCGPAGTPVLDALQEFTVESNAVSAKVSHPLTIMMSTKNGTNELHGTAFETIRNNGIGLARSRTDYYTSAPPLNRNEFGVSGGGPVFIPKLYNGKNKTFWFAGYEASRTATTSTYSWDVPTVAMRNGDFSGLVDSQGRRTTIYDPWSTGANWSRQPYPGNVIPAARQSPLAKYMFDITPLPTNNINPLLDYNWWGPEGNHSNVYHVNARVDHQFSDRDRIFGVLTEASNWQLYPGGQGNAAQAMLNDVAGWQLNKNRLHVLALTWAHTFSPTFFSETVLSGKRNVLHNGENKDGEQNFAQLLGLPNPFGTLRSPQITGTGLGNYQLGTNATMWNHENYIVLDENATKILGKHEFQFGGSIRRDLMNILPHQMWPAPTVDFSGNATGLYDTTSTSSNPLVAPYTGAGIANMYLGVGSYANTLAHPWYYLTQNENALYFQDNFKATSRLTLNFGLRWEHLSPYHDKRFGVTGFSQKDDAIVLSAPLGTLTALGATVPSMVNQFTSIGVKFETYDQAGLPQDQMTSNWKDFGPRLGFAYKAGSGKSAFVVRGGYSITYFFTALANWMDNNRSNTPMAGRFVWNVNNTTQSPDGLGNYMVRSVPTVIAGVNSQNVVKLDQATGITAGSAAVYYFDPEQPESRNHTWNLTFEKEVWEGTLARLRYGGTHGAHLDQNYCYNNTTPSYVWYVATGQPTPTGATSNIATRPYDSTTGMGNICNYRKTGWSNGNGIDLELERRFGKGYAFQLSYSMQNIFSATSDVPATNQFIPGLMPDDYDQRNELLNYRRDSSIPKHRVKWNWVADLPFGKGKKIAGNASGIVNKLIGGWQIAGIGSLRSTYFSLPTGNWNFTGEPVHIYGYQYPIQNCTSGSCIPGYLWWNGYIPANKINSVDANGKPNGYEGVPSDYKPAVTPLIPWGSTAMPVNAPAGTVVSQYWDTNTVWIPLKNGTVQRIAYSPGWNPWQNQYAPGVLQWGLDSSLFKVVPITERVRVRFNADFFNVFNHPGNPNSVGGDGMETTRTSGNSPRTLQLTLRLLW